MLERVQPKVVVFDGTWPYQGFLSACKAYDGVLALAWSNRGLFKEDATPSSVDENIFDLIIQPGELGSVRSESKLDSVRDAELPPEVKAVSVYPLARYLRAFDVFVGAAGYNSCCELVQSGIPALLVPNNKLVDDQARRARIVAKLIPAVVSPCETGVQRSEAVKNILTMLGGIYAEKPSIQMNGAALAAEAILSILD